MDDLIVFTHIPKTAGSTLKRIFERHCRDRGHFVIEGEQMPAKMARLIALAPEERTKIKCLWGHIPYGIHTLFNGKACYITLLREPVACALSWYHYSQRTPSYSQHFFREGSGFDTLKLQQLDATGFIDLMVEANMTNIQTRILAGELPFPNLLPPYPKLSKDALSTAKNNLRESYEVFGLMERFDESLLMIARALGWRNVFYRRANVTSASLKRAPLAHPVINAARSANSLDMNLYAYACELFEERVASLHPGIHYQIAAFKIANAVYGVAQPFYRALIIKD